MWFSADLGTHCLRPRFLIAAPQEERASPDRATALCDRMREPFGRQTTPLGKPAMGTGFVPRRASLQRDFATVGPISEGARGSYNNGILLAVLEQTHAELTNFRPRASASVPAPLNAADVGGRKTS